MTKTTNATHTPGPWIASDQSRHGCDYRDRHIMDDSGDILATVHAVRTTAAGRDANARLIAAAPDLLAACEAALSELEALRGVDEGFPQGETAQALRSAIAKAKGGEA